MSGLESIFPADMTTAKTPADPAAADPFEALLLPVVDKAYNTALRLTRNTADAEDLVQDAALLARRGFGSFQPGTNFSAWFFRILHNAFISKYRQDRRRGTTVELEDTPELYLFMKSASLGLGGSDDPAAALMDRIDTATVSDALTTLPDEYRSVATLYFINDMAYGDIARALDVPVGTVRSRLHRGRRLLQKQLWRLAVERGVVTDRQEGG